MIAKKTESKCWCSKTWLQLNANHIISCCKKARCEINERRDIVVNILLNNILVRRGLVTHERRLEERKKAKTAHDESPSERNIGGLTNGRKREELRGLS